MNDSPIIRIEFERMRASICRMLDGHVVEASAAIKKAIDEFCTPENIERFVSTEATRAIGDAVKEEVATFFRYGAGRKAIKEAVEKMLEQRA